MEENQTNDTSFLVSQSELEFVQNLGIEQQESLIQEFNIYLNNWANIYNFVSINIWALISFLKNNYCFWHFLGYDILPFDIHHFDNVELTNREFDNLAFDIWYPNQQNSTITIYVGVYFHLLL